MHLLDVGGADPRVLWTIAMAELCHEPESRGEIAIELLCWDGGSATFQAEPARLPSLIDDRIRSVTQVLSLSTERLSVSISAPRAFDGPRALWLLSLDRHDRDLSDTYELVLRTPECQFVALSIDDNPSFDSELVTEETFPWDWFLLVKGAVRREDGAWMERKLTGLF